MTDSAISNQFRDKNTFEEDQSLIDFDTTYSLSDTINNFYIDENDPIDFNFEEINKTRKTFASLTEPTKEKQNC